MGSFGTKPYENDTAGNWLLKTLTPVSEAITTLLALPVEAANYDEYRAAAWILTKIGRNETWNPDVLATQLSTIHDRLQAIKNDVGYIATWFEPTKFVNDLDERIQQIQRVCKWNNVIITF